MTYFKCLFLLMFGMTTAKAQQSVNTAGGTISGSGGSAGYSIGQITHNYTTGSNGSVLEGMQQGFEIYTTGISAPAAYTQIRVYPNPAKSVLTLDMGQWPVKQLSYQLFDLEAKLITSGTISGPKTDITLTQLPVTTYILLVRENAQTIQTFKIIKNN